MRTTQSLAQQNGMTLITIMIILLLVTGIGALAVKYSITSLRIASNSQVRQLLTQSSDLPLYIIELRKKGIRFIIILVIIVLN